MYQGQRFGKSFVLRYVRRNTSKFRKNWPNGLIDQQPNNSGKSKMYYLARRPLSNRPVEVSPFQSLQCGCHSRGPALLFWNRHLGRAIMVFEAEGGTTFT